ncbi:MAG: hypothetical protein WDM92_15040 [Caulobacteraceae bacterium]
MIAALGAALAGSGRPFVVTSGTGIANTIPGQPAREDNPTLGSDVIPRGRVRGGGGRCRRAGRRRLGGAAPRRSTTPPGRA